ncbi:MAG: AI-2E family transporter, partial [Patescibacteria group bacterium]
ISPTTAALTALLYLLIQQLENAVFVPRIMARAVGLNPMVTVVALLIGGRVAGIAGILLAIPVATGISVVLEDVYRRRALI